MAHAMLSVIGLYEWDHTIFDEMVIPAGMDKDILVNNILMECAELEVLLPQPDIMKKAIGFWSQSCIRVWEKLFETTQFEYNPIWNKDGTFKETETRDLTNTRNLSQKHDGDNKYDKAAYDETDYQNVDRSRIDENIKDSGTIKDGGTITRLRTEQGNIGLTSTQSLIMEERKVDEFNMYHYIMKSFMERFCILVY